MGSKERAQVHKDSSAKILFANEFGPSGRRSPPTWPPGLKMADKGSVACPITFIRIQDMISVRGWASETFRWWFFYVGIESCDGQSLFMILVIGGVVRTVSCCVLVQFAGGVAVV